MSVKGEDRREVHRLGLAVDDVHASEGLCPGDVRQQLFLLVAGRRDAHDGRRHILATTVSTKAEAPMEGNPATSPADAPDVGRPAFSPITPSEGEASATDAEVAEVDIGGGATRSSATVSKKAPGEDGEAMSKARRKES